MVGAPEVGTAARVQETGDRQEHLTRAVSKTDDQVTSLRVQNDNYLSLYAYAIAYDTFLPIATSGLRVVISLRS